MATTATREVSSYSCADTWAVIAGVHMRCLGAVDYYDSCQTRQLTRGELEECCLRLYCMHPDAPPLPDMPDMPEAAGLPDNIM